MTLTKQQKRDMIYDLELRLAKEELVEQHVKNMSAIENSEKPMQTAKDIIRRNPKPLDKMDTPEKENAPNPKIIADMKRQTLEEKELLEQSEIATKTPFKKDGLDSKTQWEFIGLETQSMRENVTEEQMQEFREKYYGGRYDALETLSQHSEENGYVTQEQIDQFTIARVESELLAQNILHNHQEEFPARNAEKQHVDFNLQEHFDNAQSMSNDHDMEMER